VSLAENTLMEIIQTHKDNKLDPYKKLVGRILNSSSLNFLNELIRSLPDEDKTCFVSMPFKPPYTDYYYNFYTPALEDSAGTVIRAWGGFGSEEYQSLMFALIEKCGLMLADISEINPNVIIEFAYAWGFKKNIVILIANKNNFRGDLFSNINDNAMCLYDTKSKNWRNTEIQKIKVFIALVKLGMEQKAIPRTK